MDCPHDVLVAGTATDRLPEMASRISASDGCGLLSRSHRAVNIIPGVQNPHCRPCSVMNPCWMGSSSPFCSRPSTVRTSCPLAIAASMVQLFTGMPSSWTTQTPQLDVSQPQCVPVRPSSSRKKCTSSSLGSISRVYSSPLTLTVTCMIHASCPRQRAMAVRSARLTSSPASARL